jgi:hypothetical protein
VSSICTIDFLLSIFFDVPSTEYLLQLSVHSLATLADLTLPRKRCAIPKKTEPHPMPQPSRRTFPGLPEELLRYLSQGTCHHENCDRPKLTIIDIVWRSMQPLFGRTALAQGSSHGRDGSHNHHHKCGVSQGRMGGESPTPMRESYLDFPRLTQRQSNTTTLLD